MRQVWDSPHHCGADGVEGALGLCLRFPSILTLAFIPFSNSMANMGEPTCSIQCMLFPPPRSGDSTELPAAGLTLIVALRPTGR